MSRGEETGTPLCLSVSHSYSLIAEVVYPLDFDQSSWIFFSLQVGNIAHVELMMSPFLFLHTLLTLCLCLLVGHRCTNSNTILDYPLYSFSLLTFVNTFSHNASLPSLPFSQAFPCPFFLLCSTFHPNKSISRLSLFFFFCRLLSPIGHWVQICGFFFFFLPTLSPKVVWVQ
ncbi:hypothetical protein K457DRAFT_559835 [Linnemannia elongata AG-77]|uniref:Uncharacterized protein n=1 Tax=Linnemannia elongata AG-77 TaxID=1314771 RepID=A0A197JVX8_9FUNG|nr:hypothetical protein K457DRAFT_559835 [Linnemannia elongata AG-77]